MKEKILTILLLINLLISGIVIGSPIENSFRLIVIVTMVIFVIYITMSKSKIKIIRNKIDIFLLLLGVSSVIPLLFGTAVSITDEVNYLFKYLSGVLLYVAIREHIIQYPHTKKYIINTIIGLSVLSILFGLDNMSSQIFTNFLQIIHIDIKEIEPNRLSSVYCYANALAITIGISILLNNGNYLKEQNKKKKAIYGTITSFLMMGLFLTYSRITLFFLGIFAIINILLLKDKQKELDLVKLLILAIVSAYIYNSLFFQLKNRENYFGLWIVTGIIHFINFLVIYYSMDLEKKLGMLKRRSIFMIGIIGLLILLISLLTIKGNLDLFKGERKEYEIPLNSILPNQEYKMKFKLKEVTINDQTENLTIQVVEMNQYNDEIKITEIAEAEWIKKEEINITTQEETDKIKIRFTKINPECKIIIQECMLNDKNIVLNYTFIPDKIEQRIQNTLLSQKGILERITFIEDGLKLIKDNWLFGKGANAWEYEQYNYQKYYYVATQVHSYIIQLGIEYGILAITSLLAIIVLLIGKYAKSLDRKEATKASVFVSILLLIVHSSLDFEMTFLYILQLFFILIAFNTSENYKIEKENKKITKIIVSFFIVILIILYIALKPYYDANVKIEKIDQLTQDLYTNSIAQKEIDQEIIKNYKEYFKLEKHTTVYAYMYYNYAHVLQRNLTQENIEQTAKELEKLYDIIKKIKPNYHAKLIVEKYSESKLVADKIKYSEIKSESLKKIQYKYDKIIVDEYEEVRKRIGEDYRSCRISKERSQIYLKKLEKLYQEALKDINEIVEKE